MKTFQGPSPAVLEPDAEPIGYHSGDEPIKLVRLNSEFVDLLRAAHPERELPEFQTT